MGGVWQDKRVTKKSVKGRGVLRKLRRVMGIVQKNEWLLI